MIAPTWLQKWLRARSPRTTPLDPLAQFSTLTVERLEERRVLSVSTLGYDGTVLDVGITGTDDVEISYDDGWMHFYSSDTDTTQSMEFDPTVNSLRIWGDADAQSVTFSDGTDPDTISLISLSVADSIEAVTVDTVVTAAMDVDIDVADTLTVNDDVTSTGGSIVFEAGGSIVINVGASLDAANSVEITSLGSSVLTQEITAGTFVDIEGMAVTLNGGIQADGAITVDATTGDLNVHGTITGGDDVSLTAANDLTIHADSGVSSTGEGNILLSADRTVTISEDVSTTGLGAITVTGNSHTGARNIVVNNGAVVSTVDGDLTLDADQGTQQSGSFSGVVVTGIGTRIDVLGAGALTIDGRGGDSSGTNQIGVDIGIGAAISGGTSGAVKITGIGGEATSGGHYGVRTVGLGATITSKGADVEVIGVGGGTGASGVSYGVYVDANSLITAGGLGNVSVHGTAGKFTGGSNFGVNVNNGSTVTSSGGNVLVTGIGGGSGTSNNNVGVVVLNNSTISAGGLGSVTVHGTGGMTTGTGNYGVRILGTNARITSAGGDVLVTGVEGGGASGQAIFVDSGGSITHTGNGNVTLVGNSVRIDGAASVSAGTGTVAVHQLTNGVEIELGSATDTIGGPLSLSDAELDRITAGKLVIGNANSGNIITSAAITSSTVGTLEIVTGGDITIANAAGIAMSGGHLILAANGTVTISEDVSTTGSGAITVTGNSHTGARNIVVNNGAVVSTVDGDLTLDADQDASQLGNYVGVMITGAGTTVEVTGTGDLAIAGRGGDTGSDNSGVRVQSGAVVRGGTSGAVSITGYGGDGEGAFNIGVDVIGAGSQITSHGADVEVTGFGGGSGLSTDNYGVYVQNGGVITSGGLGTVTVDGTGGMPVTGSGNHGVYVTGTGSQIASGGGNVEVIGRGGSGNLTYNLGVFVQSSGQITAGGLGSVTVDGTGGNATGNSNFGVYVFGPNSAITSSGGNVLVTGKGGGADASDTNFGVAVFTGGTITAGGLGTVTVEGVGGNTTGIANRGVTVSGAGSSITSNGGNVEVTGIGGAGTSGQNHGVYVESGGVITAGGSGNVSVDGTGGSTTGSSNYGVYITGTNSAITSSGGSVLVTGQGGGSGISANNLGVAVTLGAVITAGGTGTVTVEGTGGLTAGNNNFGVYVSDLSASITSNNGDVTVTGYGGGTGGSASNWGVFVETGGIVTAGGTGSVTVSGTGGQGSGTNNYGVNVRGTITSAAGDILVTGTEGGGTSGYAIRLFGAGSISHTADGNITLVGNSFVAIETSTITAGAGTVTIRQLTNDTAIDLGAATDTIGGPLSLSDAELDRITAGTLVIGNANSGAITVSADIDLTDGPVIDTLVLNTGSTVTATAGGLVVENLAISAGGAVTVTDSSTNVTNLAIGAGGDMTFTEANGLTITTVAGVNGLSTTAGAIVVTVTTGNLTIANTVAAQDLSATTGITVSLLGDDALFTLQANANLTTIAGGVSLAADKMSLLGTVTAVGQTVTLTSSNAGDAINLGSASDAAANTLELSDAELDRITAGTLVIGNANSGAITISAAISPANITTLELVTGAAIVDGNASGADITVGQLVLMAATGIGAGDALELDVDILAFRNETSGDVELVNDGFLTIDTLGSLTGLLGAELGNFGGGTTSVTATSPLTIAADLTSVGSLTLTADETDDDPDFEDVLTIAAGVTVSVTGSGETLTLQAGDDVVIDGDVLAANGSVLIAAGFGDLDAAGAILLTGTVTADDLVSLSAVTGMVGSAAVITADALEVTGSGDFDLSGDNNVNTLAADLQGALTYHDVDGFVVGTAGVTTGITLTETGAALTLSTDTGTIGLAADVITDGDQNYQSDVTLLADITLQANSGNIAFDEGIEGTFALNIASANDVTFTGDVGTVDELASLDISASGTVSILGNMQLGEDGTHTGSVFIFADTFVLNGSIDTQDAQAGSGGVFVIATLTELGGNITTADGNIDFISEVLLTGDSTLETGTGSVAILAALTGEDGDEVLSITSAAGGVILLNAVSSIGSLSLSSTAAAGTVVLSDDVAVNGDVTIAAENVLVSGSITTTDQYGNGDVSLTSSFRTTLADDIDAAGNIELAGNTRLDASITLTAGGDVTITGALDSSDLGGPPVEGLTINAIGDVFIMADLGTGITPGSHADGLAFLNVSASGDLYACGTWVIDSSVTFAPSVYLCDDLSITANGDVTFEQFVNADGVAVSTNLTIVADNVDFQGAVGGVDELTGLSITASGYVTAADGLTVVNDISITTAGSLGIALVGNVDSTSGAISLIANGDGSVLVEGDVTAETNVTVRTDLGLGGGGTITIEGSMEAATGNVLVVADEDVFIEAAIEAGGSLQVISNSGSVDIGGAVTSHSSSVYLSANDLAVANVDISIHVDGPISAAGSIQVLANADGTGKGEIWIEGSVSTTAGSVAIQGENGAVQVDGNVSTTGTVVGISGTSIDVGGFVSAQSSVTLFAFDGDILVDGGVNATTGSVVANAQQAGSIDIAGDVTAGTNVTLTTLTGSGGGTIDVGGLVDADTGFVLIQANDEITIASTIDANGAVTVWSLTGSIDIGGAVTSDAANISIIANQTVVTHQAVSLHVGGNVTAATGVSITAAASGFGTGDVWIEGDVSTTASGGIGITGTNGTVDIDGDVTTAAVTGTFVGMTGASVNVDGNIAAQTSVTVNATSGDAVVDGSIDAAIGAVNVSAQNGGKIDISGDVTAETNVSLSTVTGVPGSTIDVGGLVESRTAVVNIQATADITIGATVDAEGSVVVISRTGSVDIGDAVTSRTQNVELRANFNNVPNQAVSLNVGGAVTAETTVSLSAFANGTATGDVSVNGNITSNTASVSVTGANGVVEIDGDVSAGGANVGVGGAEVTILGDVSAQTFVILSAVNGDLVVDGSVDAVTGGVTASAQNGGKIDISGDVTAETNVSLSTIVGVPGSTIDVGGLVESRTAVVNIQATADITIGATVDAEGSVVVISRTGSIDIGDAVTSRTQNVELRANFNNVPDQAVSLNVGGAVTAETTVSLSAFANGTATGDVSVNGNVTSNTASVSVTGANGVVEIDGDVSAGGANVGVGGNEVTILGDVSAQTFVILSAVNGDLVVDGSVDAVTGGVTASAQNGGKIDISGDVTAETNVSLSTIVGVLGSTIDVGGLVESRTAVVNIQATSDITIGATVDAEGSVVVVSRTGSIDIGGGVTSQTANVQLTSNFLNIANQPVSLQVGGSVTADTTVSLLALASGTGSGDISVTGDVTSLTSSVSITGVNGLVEINGDVAAQGANANVAGAEVTILGDIAAQTSVAVTATNGDATIDGNATASGGNLTIHANQAGSIDVSGDLFAQDAVLLSTLGGTGGGSIDVGGSITSDQDSITLLANDDLEVTGPVLAATNVTATTLAGTMTFSNTMDATAGFVLLNNAGLLTLLGDVTAGTTFEQNGGDVDLCANVKADDGIDFEGDVTLTMDVTLTTVDGNVIFQSTVETDGLDAWDLTINSATGNVEFQDTVGTAVGKELGAVDIITGGDVSLTERFVTVDDITISAAEVLIDDVDTSAAAGALGNLTITHTGDLQLRDVELAGNFLENGGGTTFFDGSITTTDGNVTFTGQVQVHDGEIETDTGNVTFQSTVNGAATGGLTLLIASNTGDIDFQDAVGSVTELSTLTTDSNGATSFGSTLDLSANLLVNQNATTPGAVTFSDAVDVGGAATIAGNSVQGTSLTAVGAVSVTAGTGGLAFTGNVQSTDSSIGLESAAVTDAISIGGDVLAATTVTINSTAGNVDLGGVVTATSGSIDIDAATDIDVVGTLTAGTTIDIDAGTSIALHADLLADNAITVTANNGAIDVSGNVTSNDGSITLESLAGAALVHVGGNLLAATSITIDNLTGAVELDGTVTATSGDIDITADTLSAAQALTAGTNVVIVTTNGTTLADVADVTAGGMIDITGDLLTAANLQTTTGAITVDGNVTLTGDARFDSDDDVGPAGTGNITVTGTIDLSSFTLTIDAGTGGDIDLQDTVSGTGDLIIEEGNNQTYATISVNDFRIEDATTSVVLNGPVTATAVGMDLGDIFISSRGTLNIESTLTADGTVTLKADGGMKLDDNLDVGNIEFQSAVLLCTDITITATGNVIFGSTVDSAANQQYSLVVNAAGLTDFQGAVGGGANQQLGSLTTDAAGQTFIGANVTTAFDQVYLDAVTLTADVTLTGTDNNATGEAIEFHNALDGDGFDLTVVGGGAFAAAVTDLGDFIADRIDTESTFAAASIDVSGTADLGGNVSTTGTQQYGNAVLLTADVIVSSTGVGAAGNITFASTIDGAFDLTITSAGTTRFEGIVGGGTELTRLTTNGGGTTVIDTTAVTAGDILFEDDVVLAQSTTVTGTNSLEFAGALSGLSGSENLLAISGGAATFAAISNLTNVTIDAAGITTLQGDISITGTLSTIGGNVTKIDTASIEAGNVQFGDAVELCQDLSISAATITFDSTVDEAVGAAGSRLTLEITDPNAAAGDITFADAVGSLRALESLLIVTANDVTFASTVQIDGDLIQQDGTGTTEFRGTSGTGIGGELQINTNIVDFYDLTIVAVGAVVITAQNGITFHANSGLNAGSSTIALRANQDQNGTQGFTQASGTIIQTTNNTSAALVIEVGGDGSAAISDLRADSTSGVVTMTVGGSITDNSVLETANITAAGVALTAVTGIGGVGDADIDTQVANLEAQTTTGGIVIQEADDVTLGGVTGSLGGVDVLTSGDISIATINGSIAVSEQVSGPDNISLVALGSTSDLTILLNSGVVSTNDHILLSADRTVTISEDVATSGVGTITVTGNSGAGARNIVVNSGAVVTVVNGDLLLDADQGSQQTGNFSGISIDNATLQTTGTGDVTLQGRGGNHASGSQTGVSISNGGVVQSTSNLATAGTIEISGIGGVSTGNNNAGISISGATSTVQSVNGDVTLTGTGGGTGTSAGNAGIIISGSVRSTGTTADAAEIVLTGQGGLSTGEGNLGIDINGANALVTSVRGAIALDGTGGGSGASGNNVGVRIAGGGDVTSTGTAAAGVEIQGQGGASTGGGNTGVLVTGTGTTVSAVTGTLEIVGVGGGVGVNGGNHGLVIENAALVASTGTGVGAATISLDGTGSASTGDANRGVMVDAATVATVNGTLSITGQGGGAGASGQNHGVLARNAAVITSSGLGDIAITGSGGTGTGGQNHGVVLNQADVVSNGNSVAAPGDIAITATAGTGPDSLALLMSNGGSISANDPLFPGGATVTLTTLAGDVREESGFVILSDNLLLLGPGSFTLNEDNNVGTLAADVGGFLAFNDVNGLTVGTVKSTSGITTSNDDVKLTVLAGGLTIGDNVGVAGADDITLGSGNLTLNVVGDVTQTAGNVITASGLQLLGTGTVTLNEADNNVSTIAANYNGTISYTDANALIVGTVTDAPSGMSTSGITTSNDDVKLTVLAGGLTIGDNVGVAGADDITLGSGNLTLNVVGDVTQTADNVITASGLQLLGTGTVMLNEAGNDVTTLAANYNGTISYTDANALIVGTVTDAPSGMSTSGITTSNDDVKLTVLAGGLTIGDNVGVAGTDDITLGTGNLTLNVVGNVTQTAGNVITASGLQLLGTGTVTLNEAGNDVTTLAANYNGTISYTDANALIVGTVTDAPSGMSTSGITTSNDDVKLTVLAGGLTIGDSVGVAGTDDITLGTGNLTLNVVGNVTQTAGNVITASGLQLLGTGTVTLNEAGNNVSTIAANYNGSISYVDADTLIVGTVTDQAEMSMVSSTGIASNGGHVSLTAADALTVNADINTSPGAGGAITVTGGEINAQLIAGAGNITLNGGNPDLIINVDQTSATTMTLQANRDVIINAVVSTTGPGADIVVTADLDQDGVGGIQVTQTGQLAAADDLTLTGSDLFATPLSSDSIRIEADGSNDQLLAGGQILLQHHAVAPATADIVINGRIRSTGGDIIINAADEIHATSAIRAEGATGSITFEDAVVLTGHLDVTSGGNTTFAGTVSTADFDLTVDGGPNGDVTFELAVTGGGHLTVTNGDDIRFDGVVQVDNLSVLAATSTVTFVSAVTVQQDVSVTSAGSITQQSTLSAGNDVTYVADGAILIQDELTAVSDISLTSTLSSITATAALEATNGNLTASAGTSFSATQTLTAGHRVDVDAVTTLTLAETADITAGVGGVNLSATDIITAAEIITASGDVTLTGAVRLTGDVTIDTGAAGDVTVTGSIDATTDYAQSLFLSTGTGDILVTGNIGSTTALGDLVITAARDVTFGADISASRLLLQSGTGVTTVVGNVETFGVGGIQLTTTSIQFADLTSSMDSHGNIIILTADAITLPTTFTNAIGSTVTLQTLTAGTSIGLEDASQDLNFTDAQLDTIHSANLIIGSANQTAGIIVGTDGPVSLDENLTLLTAGTIQVTGALSATAGNWMLLDAGDDIAITGSVSTLSGDLTLRADDDITLGGMALVASGSGNISVRADADHDANGSGGGITMADGAIINSGTGRLSLEADEDIVIGQLASSNGTTDAISIVTHSGGVVDGGDTDLDIVLNNAAGVVTIHAVTGVGSATGGGADAALETQINQLQVVNSTSGDVRIDEVDALTILGIEQFGPGDVVVHAGGTMTVAAGGPGIQSQGGDLRLTTVGATSDLVLNSALTSRGGDVVLVVGDDLIQTVSAPIDTGSGHLTMNVVGDVDFAGSIDTVGGDLTATVGGNLQQAATAPISTNGGDLTLDVLGDVELAAAVATSGGNIAATIGGNLTQVDTAPVSTEGGHVVLDVIGNVSLAATVSTDGGSLTVFIDGDLTQAASAPIDTDGGDFLLDVGGKADFAGAVSTNGGDWVGVIGGDFTQSTTAPITTGGGELDLTVGGQMSLAGLVDTAGGNLKFDVTGDLTQATTAPITTEGGNVVLLVDGNLSLAALLATSGGQVLLDIGGSAAIAETAPINTGGGQLTATIDQQLSLASLVETSGGNVQLTVGQSANLAATAAILTENGNFQGLIGSQFTMADGAVINTSSGTISLIAGSHITVGQLITTNATSAALLLRSTGGGIIDGGDTGGADLIANAAGSVVTIEAAQGVGSAAGFGADAAIETQINTLILRNTTTGNVRLSEVDALRILELKQTASGSVTVDAVGNLHLVGGQPGVTATSGNVTLRATGAASSVTIDSLVQTTSGQILVSAAQNVTMGAAGRILSQTGNVNVVADSDNSVNGAGGALFMANGAIINAGTGNITARADGNITVGQMLTTQTVSLTSTSAGVVDGGDAGGVDIQANALVIQTRTGIGSTNPLETSVAQLAARNTTSGAIRIENSSGNLLTIGQIGSVSGITNNGGPASEISIVNAGGITVDRDVRNTTGGNIRLTANANGGNDDHLTVNAVIAASGGNGSILLTAGNNLILNDTGADVDMSVVNGGEILGSAGNDVLIGPDVVIQSATGVVTNTEPVLIDVLTPQISALGVGTVTMTVQRPLEVGTVIIIDWGDGTVETFVVTEEGQTTLTFTHQYLGPPDLANPAADIPIKVTVHNPSFTTGAMASPTAGSMRVANGDYVPNIRFAANGEILSPFDIGPLNETIFNGVFKIPGDGLASFVFDLTPPVQILDFPQGSSLDASLLAVPQPPTQMNALDGLVTAAEDLQADERVVILEVLGPDGEVREQVILSEDVLDDMDSVVRQLPDGRYRFQLREPGDTQTRLLQEVLIREGKISDEFDTSTDRPRSLKTQGSGMAAPVDNPEENSPPVDALVPENQRVDADNSDADAAAVSSFRGSRAWRQALARAEGGPVDEVAGISDDSGESDDSTWAAGMFAAPAVGSAISGRRFGRAARLLRQYGQP